MHEWDALFRALKFAVDERDRPGSVIDGYGALIAEALLFVCSQRSRGRDGRVLVLVLGLSARCQIVFEGIHVRWQFCNLAENEREVHVEEG